MLFGAVLDSDAPSYEAPLQELERLAETAGATVTKKIAQKRQRAHPATFVGPGFVERVNEAADEFEADVLIADNSLSPAQAHNIEKRTKRKVIDRTELILDIFASHARSKESQVAVELAQLQYALPRLKRMWTHLERQRGGIGMRGPGETQLETDRQLIKKRISELKRALVAIQKRKEREIKARKGEFTVALVGYTNAGKSTLMNALSGGEQFVADQLFATLDTKTRIVEVKKNRRVLLSDTVGFIQKIPHNLVASFHATLEEVITADLLLHVIDVTHPDPKAQIEAVDHVLEQLGANELPVVMVFNKVDALEDHLNLSFLKRSYRDHVVVSAKTRYGIDGLKERIAHAMRKTLLEKHLRISVEEGKAIAFLHKEGEIIEERYEGNMGHFHVLMSEKHLGVLRRILRHSQSRSGERDAAS
ncbi:MAG: GTPase HflX [Planctomycetota bacterium]